MAQTGTDIEKAKALLIKGELVAIPTETVYGLAGNALEPSSVAKIFEVKGRPQFDPLIVHVPDFESAQKYALDIPEQAAILAQHFWPGPLTLLLPKKDIIPDLVTSGLDTVGLRCPDHPLTHKLLETLPFPLAAPSANPFGYVSPTCAEHVEEQLGDKIAYILDGGPCKIGVESTIAGFENSLPIIYRLGGITQEQIELVVGKVNVRTHSTSNPKAPGQLQSHYAPRKKVILGNIDDLLKQYGTKETGILSFQHDFNSSLQFILSPSGQLTEAAQNLFLALRMLDKMPIKYILAEPVPDVGLGKAINDRLRRAAG
ncbi:L-threonylcarbamoyladenylate synthase [Chryseolinea sp. H1M3-3]|uniref:L-threonylcarbamoyladenylate synthase n=1 Tax=Chryseolinea sp. H1M3-3 TaxID=3034144 RepID=UPI0023EC1158|nr:L-threonylcarbamoyladenylate synthase [Chryseolinea sp. H1M3-3]